MKFMQKITLSVIASLTFASGMRASQASSTRTSTDSESVCIDIDALTQSSQQQLVATQSQPSQYLQRQSVMLDLPNVTQAPAASVQLASLSPVPLSPASSPTSFSSSSSVSETESVAISIASPTTPTTPDASSAVSSSSYSAYSTSSITQQPTRTESTTPDSANDTNVRIDVVDENQNPLCAQIAEQNLKTVPQVKPRSIGDFAAKEDINDPLVWYNFWTYPIIHPTEHDQLERAYAILASAEQSQKIGWTSQSIMEATTRDDLNILSGSQNQPHIFLGSQIANGHIQTKLGQAFFSGLLARPTHDITLLQARQAIIHELITDETLYKEVDGLLKKMATEEKLLTGLWGQEDLMQFVMKEDFFSTVTLEKYPRLQKFLNVMSSYGNKSSVLLACRRSWQDLQSVLGVGVTTVMPFAFITTGVLAPFGLAPQIATSFTGSFIAAAGILPALLYTIPQLGVQSGTASLTGGYQGFNLYRNLKQAYVGLICWNDFLLKRMGTIVSYFKSMQSLHDILAKSNVAKHLSFFKAMEQVLQELPKQNADVEQLFTLFKSSTLSNTKPMSDTSRSFFYNKGRMLCAYQLLVRHIKTLLEPALAGVGEIDAYLASAKMVKEAEKTSTPYCFVKYDVTSKTPVVDLTNFWSPFCNRQKVVPNSLQLGATFKTPNIIVTGPNSAGKSTILKGVALSIVMAQSLGIAPAQAMTLTPFEYLVTYMNVADSQVDQESRFQAESRRLFEYGDIVEKLSRHNGFSCAFFDEVCSGTSPYEGAKLGYCYGYELAKKPNCMSIIATHFESITQLERDTHGAFINYQVPVATTSTGSLAITNNRIQRPFKITPGISTQHIACDVFREKGIKSKFWTTLEGTIDQYDLKQQTQQQAAATLTAASNAKNASQQAKS